MHFFKKLFINLIDFILKIQIWKKFYNRYNKTLCKIRNSLNFNNQPRDMKHNLSNLLHLMNPMIYICFKFFIKLKLNVCSDYLSTWKIPWNFFYLTCALENSVRTYELFEFINLIVQHKLTEHKVPQCYTDHNKQITNGKGRYQKW